MIQYSAFGWLCRLLRQTNSSRERERRMIESDRSGVIHLAEARMGIPGPAGDHSVSLLRRGSLQVRLSLPVVPNQQTPHEQDEVYVIIRGRGILLHDGEREPFEAGDLLSVAAGTEHHFEDFTEDLAVWVVFYGPGGGELPV
jgi:mannose-6-phosphate isomerase-like protein (cupin superfamily)